jgi:hypothetical protein
MDTIFGYEIPMPASDVYTAIATVAAFLPAVFIVHRAVVYVLRLLPKTLKQE